MLKEYLEFESQVWPSIRDDYAYRTPRDYVKQHGRLYESQALTGPELGYLARLIHRVGHGFPIRQCYANSQELVLASLKVRDDEHQVKYVEGMTNAIIPIDHGWLTINSKVVDPTLRFRDCDPGWTDNELLPSRVVGLFPEHREYLGVEFSVDDVKAYVRRLKQYGTMIDNYWEAHPLLRKTA